MRFPQTFIDDLKRQADIVRIVQDYVTLKKTGANWVACCPFHKETKPSFSVNPSKEIFYCFGCQKGGSVFNFVMEIERATFPEAIKIVAEKSGVALPKMIDDGRFEAQAARSVREYLKERGITEETSQTFKLGFAPDSWEALSTHLRQKGATQEQLEKSGLVVTKDEGGSYDRFRGRLMFPVFDAQGKPIAFGGRILDPEGEPKYLNSPETSAYVKGRHLYGLHLTRDEIRRAGFAILVEGYLDLIVPYQFGVRNVVASLGTALTPEQVKLIGRFARKVVVNYDGDRAGVQAAKRAIETILAEDIEVKVLVLPDNADPDDFIRKHGVSEYQRRRGEAQPHIQFVIDQAVRDRSLQNPADKAVAVEETLPFVRAVRNRIQKREYFDIVMDSLRVQGDQRRELWQQVLILPRLEPRDYEGLATAPIFQSLKELGADDKEISFESLSEATADNSITAEVLPRLMINAAAESFDESLADANSCLDALRLIKLDRDIDELSSRIAEADRAGEDQLRDQLAMKKLGLSKQRGSFLPHGKAAN